MEEFKTILAGTLLCVQASDIDYYRNYGVFIVLKDIRAEDAAAYNAHFAEAENDLTWWPNNDDGVKWLIHNQYITPVGTPVNLCVGTICQPNVLSQEDFDDYEA